MKNISKLIAVASFVTTGLSATIVPLDFTDTAIEAGSSFTFSSAGDQWRATDVGRLDPNYAGLIDAVFTITGTTGISATNNVAFVTEAARGNNMRVRVGGTTNVTNATVFINIQFVDAGTNDPFTGWLPGADLITQFSDLDSDAGFDRTDFGGIQVGQPTFKNRANSDDITPGSSLLVFDTTSVAGYEIGRMATPWGPQGNVTATDAFSQSPVDRRVPVWCDLFLERYCRAAFEWRGSESPYRH